MVTIKDQFKTLSTDSEKFITIYYKDNQKISGEKLSDVLNKTA